MMNQRHLLPILLLSLLLGAACSGGPKVITENEDNPTTSPASSGIFSETTTDTPQNAANPGPDGSLHQVVVHEILPAERYVYLQVHEGQEMFWIATRKQEVNLGGTYYYKGGLLKTNFESKEHNRTFDRIFLVSKLVPADHGQGGVLPSATSTPSVALTKEVPTTSWTPSAAGSITIAELVKHPEKYAGKTVKVSGKCVKINPNIMGKNWIHLQDGSQDDFDLVITSDLFVPEGSVISMQAVVALNRDFGAGYQYQLILEEGTLQ